MPMRRLLSLSVLLSLNCAPPTPESPTASQPAPQPAPPSGPVDSLAAAFAAGAGLPSFVVGVIEDGEERIYAYGALDSRGTPPDAHTRYEIGSISKGLVALALADMVVKGEVALDDPLARFLPDSVRAPVFGDGAGAEPVRLAHLATHTSGLPLMPPGERVLEVPTEGLSRLPNPYADFDPAALMRLVGGFTPTEAPGAAYAYSNVGGGLLAWLLARREGLTVEAFVRARVLGPLGMSETGLDAARLASAMHPYGMLPHWAFSDALVGASSFRSSAYDLLKLARAFLEPDSTSLAEAIRLATAPRLSAERFRVGLAWQVVPLKDGLNPRLVYHDGLMLGATAFVGAVPEKGIAAVVLTNTATQLNDFAFTLLARLCGADCTRRPGGD